MTEPDFDRRAVLRALALLGVTGVTASVFGGTAEASGTSPLDLKFAVEEKFRPFDLIAPKFVQLDTRARPGALVDTRTRPKSALRHRDRRGVRRRRRGRRRARG
jgi:hypothetical protein